MVDSLAAINLYKQSNKSLWSGVNSLLQSGQWKTFDKDFWSVELVFVLSIFDPVFKKSWRLVC